MAEPLPHVQPGNVLLVVLVGFIIIWGAVYGLWRWWPLPAVVLAWAVIPRRNR